MRKLLVLVPLLAVGCGSDGASPPPDLQIAGDLVVHHCIAIACTDGCPGTNRHCIVLLPSDSYGGCTDGQSTCGTPLTGDCSFTTRCLGPNTLGTLFVAYPEGGCAIERIHCANGCVGDDGGANAPRCQ